MYCLCSTYFHVNGLSYHFHGSPTSNAYLYGGGIHYDWLYLRDTRIGFLNGTMVAFEVDIFNDSQRHWAYAAGLSLTRPLKNVRSFSFDLGVTAGLIYKKNLRENSDLPLFPLAFPFVQFGTAKIKVRTTWIPPVRSAGDNQFFFQLLLRLRRK